MKVFQINAKVLFHILKDNSFSAQIILGRDFLLNNEISCLFKYTKEKENERLKLFSEVASADVLDTNPNALKNLLEEIDIDFDENVKKQLISTILKIENTKIFPVDDNYYVKIKLKIILLTGIVQDVSLG